MDCSCEGSPLSDFQLDPTGHALLIFEKRGLSILSLDALKHFQGEENLKSGLVLLNGTVTILTVARQSNSHTVWSEMEP